MRELNLLEGYPKPQNIRFVSKNLRTINHRLIALKRDENFFDGDRNYGYGGYVYDGRWQIIAENIIKTYSLKSDENILQINSEKGFLLKDLKNYNEKLNLFGTETSNYAIKNTVDEVNKNIIISSPNNLPFDDNYFDFVLALGVVYTASLDDAIKIIKEIVRVCKNNSFITLASYSSIEDYFLFRDWTLLGTTVLKKNEWIEVLKYCNYTGDYFFTNAETLNLKRK
jgi:SAM-dependent methyltransferase